MPRIYTRLTLAEKLSRHTRSTPEVGCWLWQGATLTSGYGHLGHDGKYLLAHRAAYEVAFGPIPKGMIVMHTCDNPACVRPDHLRIGTYAENMADMHGKGRGRKAETYRNQTRRTHCYKGHEFTPDNVIWTAGGKARRCLICYRASSRAGALRYLANHRAEINRKRRARRAEARQAGKPQSGSAG